MRCSIFGSLLFKLFVGFSLADLSLTTWLLCVHPDWVVESNPVANWWLAQFGIAGMAGFKVVAVLLVGLICQRLARLRPQLSRGILAGACLTVLGVVGYSLCLMNFVNQEANRLDLLTQDEILLDKRLQQCQEFAQLVDEMADQLRKDQITLKQAVHQLLQTERITDPNWVGYMKYHYGSELLDVCLARSMIKHLQIGLPKTGGELVLRLERQLLAEFGETAQFYTGGMTAAAF